MEPLTPDALQGTWSTLLLPLDDSENIRWDGIESQLDALARAQIDGIYFNGTAGEFFSQTDEEFIRLATMVANFCHNGNIPFQIGAAHPQAIDTLKRIKESRHLSPGAFQIILPEWTPLNWEELNRFLERVIAAAHPIPIVLYNPPYAQKILKPEEWSEISARFPALIGIKVAGGDATWHEEMRPVSNSLSVFVAGTQLASGLVHGCASGSYSNVVCLSPKGACEWEQRMRSDPEIALQQEAQIQNVFADALSPFRHRYSNTALDKALATCGGWAEGLTTNVRWPLSKIPTDEIESLATQFRAGLPFLFE